MSSSLLKLMTLSLLMVATTVVTTSAFAQQQSGRSIPQAVLRHRAQEEQIEERDEDLEIAQEQQGNSSAYSPAEMASIEYEGTHRQQIVPGKTGYKQEALTVRGYVYDTRFGGPCTLHLPPRGSVSDKEMFRLMEQEDLRGQECRAAARKGRF